MRLYSKIGLGVLAVMLAASAIGGAIIALFLQATYSEMDETAIKARSMRLFGFVQAEMQALGSTTRDWGHWDDTYDFAETLDAAYVVSNLKAADFQNLRIDSFTLIDAEGIVRFHSRDRLSAAPLFAPGSPLPDYARFADLPPEDLTASREGVLVSPEGALLASVTPVLASSNRGPARGFLLFTRSMSGRFANTPQSEAAKGFELKKAGRPAGVLPNPVNADSFVFLEGARGAVAMGRQLLDLAGRPSYLFSVSMPRDFEAIGWKTLLRIFLALGALTLITAYAVAVLIGRLVTQPLENMLKHMNSMAASGDMNRAFAMDRQDEVGQLAAGFNRMLGELKDARNRLAEKSYASGMADLAAGVLHNVRNALSPIVTASWRLRSLLGGFSASHLSQAGRELAESGPAEERRSRLGEYVFAFAADLAEKRVEMNGQLDAIDSNCRHIQLYLEDRDQISRGVRSAEPVDYASVVKEISRSVAPPIRVEIDNSVGDAPPVIAHRFVLRNVLGNLFSNAVAAIAEQGQTEGTIRVFARTVVTDVGWLVELTVSDSGKGFPAGESDKLFQRGFTTRANGSGGFGLHWCATTLSSMKGAIRGESEGPGCGASFSILLPAAFGGATEEAAI